MNSPARYLTTELAAADLERAAEAFAALAAVAKLRTEQGTIDAATQDVLAADRLALQAAAVQFVAAMQDLAAES